MPTGGVRRQSLIFFFKRKSRAGKEFENAAARDLLFFCDAIYAKKKCTRLTPPPPIKDATYAFFSQSTYAFHASEPSIGGS